MHSMGLAFIYLQRHAVMWWNGSGDVNVRVNVSMTRVYVRAY